MAFILQVGGIKWRLPRCLSFWLEKFNEIDLEVKEQPCAGYFKNDWRISLEHLIYARLDQHTLNSVEHATFDFNI